MREVTATRFKAQCLALLDEAARRSWAPHTAAPWRA